VKEQMEEETLVMNLLDKMKIAGDENVSSKALYSSDRDLEKTPDETRSAQDVTLITLKIKYSFLVRESYLMI
jgi:ferritin